jgi:hypothetical protein
VPGVACALSPRNPARLSHGALLALAGRLPAPILAERLGIHQAPAAQWVRTAGATYSGYVELRPARDVGDVP